MDHFQNPRNQGKVPDATGTGVSGAPGRGPYIVIQIRCEQNVVVRAGFQCHNCGVTVACGSVLTEIAEGRTLAECSQITADEVSLNLDGVPPDKQHVPEFALAALRMAVTEAAE